MLKICQTLITLLIFLAPIPVSSAQLVKSYATSLRDMEYYYQHQNPETIANMLRALIREKSLAKGEVRLTTAAFLAEIFKKEPKVAQKILAEAPSLDFDTQRMLLWAVHLSGKKTLEANLKDLKAQKDPTIVSQIASRPHDLKQWNLTQSESILHMYWGAFFAYGNLDYLDAIIDAAILQGELKAEGRTQDPKFKGTLAACATLYEMAPRHKSVRKRLEERLQKEAGAPAETLKIILNSR
ncbi:MAG: translation initiation factor 2 [Desulfovibrionaceae bacterium]|nr:translation initiation factor 2 [Desulfovibrionaceae bacterium]